MFYTAIGAEPCSHIHKGQTFKVTQSNSSHQGSEQPYKKPLLLKLGFAPLPDCCAVLDLAFRKHLTNELKRKQKDCRWHFHINALFNKEISFGSTRT